MLRATYSRKWCSSDYDNFNLCDSFTYTRQGVQKVVEFRNTRKVSNYKDAEEQEFSHSM